MEGCGALNAEQQIPGLEAAASELSAAVGPCSKIENRGILALTWAGSICLEVRHCFVDSEIACVQLEKFYIVALRS